ncbi:MULTISPECIES: ABC transporter substrate-binding protein [Amycolatopsis]|uniref:ABC transporter substrate-binding protein n=1 Tax=Amycolatopsis albidoflavus TaxID=102226 RepID=A0ABW5HSH2_9PSEU
MNVRGAAAAAAGVLAAAFLAGCGGGGASNGNADTVLNVGMPNGPLTKNNNVLLSSSPANSLGYGFMIYEPLVMTNAIRPADPGKPWLATKWDWSDNYTTLVLTVRDKVNWSDGKPMTAADVAYTFELLKKHPALNGSGIPFGDITASGNRVTLTFPASQFVNRNKILDQAVLPEHQWSAMKDPETDIVANPVGTGPYTIKSATSQTVTLAERSDYWQSLPAVKEIRYTSYSDNDTQSAALATGACDWSFVFLPNANAVFVSKDPAHHKLWFPPTLAVHGLWLNNQTAPFDDVVLRRAVNLAVNRHDVFTQGEGGYFYPEVTSVTGLPLPAGEPFLAPAFRGKNAAVDVESAKKMLTAAGYSYAGTTLRDRSGKPVTLALSVPAGWSDYVADLEIIKDNLAAIGISATVDRLDQNVWNTNVDTGRFGGTLHWTNAGATPYDLYESAMDGALLKPIGTGGVAGNWGRFSNGAATNALRQYAQASDEGTRNGALETLQQLMADQVPMIPLVAVNDGGEYNTAHWTGWADEQNQYAGLQPNKMNALQIVSNLKPAG